MLCYSILYYIVLHFIILYLTPLSRESACRRSTSDFASRIQEQLVRLLQHFRWNSPVMNDCYMPGEILSSLSSALVGEGFFPCASGRPEAFLPAVPGEEPRRTPVVGTAATITTLLVTANAIIAAVAVCFPMSDPCCTTLHVATSTTTAICCHCRHCHRFCRRRRHGCRCRRHHRGCCCCCCCCRRRRRRGRRRCHHHHNHHQNMPCSLSSFKSQAFKSFCSFPAAKQGLLTPVGPDALCQSTTQRGDV